jgi:hypothetical protein
MRHNLHTAPAWEEIPTNFWPAIKSEHEVEETCYFWGGRGILFICELFYDIGKALKGSGRGLIKVLPCHLLGTSEENHGKPQSV